MAKMKTIDTGLLSEVVRRLVAEFAPEEIVLFDSHAWGTPSEDSDVDLLVIVSESSERPTQRARRPYRCLRGLPLPKDILVKTRAEMERFQGVYASLERQILERGKILYDREQTGLGAIVADQGGT